MFVSFTFFTAGPQSVNNPPLKQHQSSTITHICRNVKQNQTVPNITIKNHTKETRQY